MNGTKLYRSDNILDVPYRDVPKKQKGHFSIEQNAIDNTTEGSLVDWPVSLPLVGRAEGVWSDTNLIQDGRAAYISFKDRSIFNWIIVLARSCPLCSHGSTTSIK